MPPVAAIEQGMNAAKDSRTEKEGGIPWWQPSEVEAKPELTQGAGSDAEARRVEIVLIK